MDIVFYILLLVSAISVIRAVRLISVQKAHLRDDEISDFVRMKTDVTSDEYTRFIGHLAGCEACQQRLNEAQNKFR
jgi:hypothetical protein